MKKYKNKIQEFFTKILIKISINRKVYLRILVSLVILLSLIPLISRAFVFDPFNTALEGIEELAGPFLTWIIKIFLLLLGAYAALEASTFFLEKTLEFSSDLLTTKSAIVMNGWTFVANISNMVIIIALIFIALSTILKIGKAQLKKYLPKLILAALLVNFSLLMVGAVIDVTNILYNTIFEGNESMVGDTISTMKGEVKTASLILGGTIGVYAGLMVFPFTAPFAQVGVVIAMVTGSVFFESFIILIMQVVCSYLISAVFFMLGATFLLRIFYIQFLAIISPIALVSIVMPFTEKYWKKWLAALGKWAFVGILLIMFLVLGFRSVGELLKIDTGTSINKYLLYYGGLVVFLIAAYNFAKKQTPEIVGQIFSGIKTYGKIGISKGIKPFGQAMGRHISDYTRGQEERARNYEGKTKGFKYRIHKAGNGLAWLGRRGHYLARTSPEVEKEKKDKRRQEYLKNRFQDPERFNELKLGAKIRGKFLSEEALASRLTFAVNEKGDKGLRQFNEKTKSKGLQHFINTNNQEGFSNIVKHDPTIINNSTFTVTSDSGITTSSFEKMIKKEDPDLKSIEKLGYEKGSVESFNLAEFKKVLKETKIDDIKKYSENVLHDQKIQLGIMLSGSNKQIKEFAEQGGFETGEEMAKVFNDEIEKLGLTSENFAKLNGPAHRFMNSVSGKILFGNINYK